MYQHDGQHHRRRVLDGPEPQLRVAHRGAEVVERAGGERAEDKIEKKAKKKLNIDNRDENEAQAVRAVAARSAAVGHGCCGRGNACRECGPADPGMKNENGAVHAREPITL